MNTNEIVQNYLVGGITKTEAIYEIISRFNSENVANTFQGLPSDWQAEIHEVASMPLDLKSYQIRTWVNATTADVEELERREAEQYRAGIEALRAYFAVQPTKGNA